jgi:hypothetical protein
VILADPGDLDAVWFAADNAVYHYRIGDVNVMRAFVSQPISPNSFFIDGRDRSGGVLIGAGSGMYTRVSATGSVQQNVPASSFGSLNPKDTSVRFSPQTVRSVYARFRSLQDYERLITQDAALRSWPVISAAATPLQSEAWIGTGGAGIFRVDPLFNKSEHLPFGLLSDGAGAIGLAADGVWIGGAGRPGSVRDGLTVTDHELRRWRWIDGGAASPFAGARVTAISQYGSVVWVATDRGVLRVDNQSGVVSRAWDGGGGVPLAIVARRDGAWVGTGRGLSFVHNPDPAVRAIAVDAPVLQDAGVRAIATRGDTVWIGSEAGLLALAPGATAAQRLRAANTDARLRQPVAAIAASDSIVMVATTSGDVFRVSAATGDPLDQNSIVNPGRVGRVYGMALDTRTLWLVGESGLLVVNRVSGTQRFLSATAELAGPAYGVVLSKDYAWVACYGGAVRLRRTSDGTIR